MKNLYVALDGGIGNQLFQYAFAKSIALRFDYNLVLYADAIFERQAHGGSCIADIFDLNERCAISSDVRALAYLGVHKEIRRIFGASKLGRLFLFNAYVEGDMRSIDVFAKKHPKGFLISGYFQSEDFFYDFRSVLRSILKFRSHISEIVQQIQLPKDAIFVHVRRGDYVSNSKNKGIYYELGADYYGPAIARQFSELGPSPIVIFSDDLDYAHELIKPYGDIFNVDRKGLSSSFDLALMATGKRFIIANSTFSWWGAWIAERKEGLVIAPKNWYCNPGEKQQRIIPERWLKV